MSEIDVVAELLLEDWARSDERRDALVSALVPDAGPFTRDTVALCLPALRAVVLRVVPFARLMRMVEGMFGVPREANGEPRSTAGAQPVLAERVSHIVAYTTEWSPEQAPLCSLWALWSTWYVASCERPYRSEASLPIVSNAFLGGEIAQMDERGLNGLRCREWNIGQYALGNFLDFRTELGEVRDTGIPDLSVPPQSLCLDLLYELGPMPQITAYRAPADAVDAVGGGAKGARPVLGAVPGEDTAWEALLAWPERNFGHATTHP